MEKKDGTGSEIIYHFDVEQHRIPLQQFIDTADTTKDILDDFNRQFFGGKLKYGLYVVPSEKGGLLEILQLILAGGGILGAAVAITAIMNNIGQFLDTRTGEFFYEKHKGEPLPWLKDTIDKNDTDHKSDEGMKAPVLSKEKAESFLAFLPSYFLSENVKNLKAVGITPDKLPKAFKARNKFYDACIGNKKVWGIAFNRSHDFSIKRERFKGLRVDPPEEAVELQEFQFETIDIVVHSPDWEFNETRRWQCRDTNERVIMFIIEDAVFSRQAKDKDKNIKPDIIDTMQVQWIYQGKKSKRKNVRVLNVTFYNGKKISKRLTMGELQKKCDHETILVKKREDNETANNIFNLFPDRLNSSKNDLEDDFED